MKKLNKFINEKLKISSKLKPDIDIIVDIGKSKGKYLIRDSELSYIKDFIINDFPVKPSALSNKIYRKQFNEIYENNSELGIYFIDDYINTDAQDMNFIAIKKDNIAGVFKGIIHIKSENKNIMCDYDVSIKCLLMNIIKKCEEINFWDYVK